MRKKNFGLKITGYVLVTTAENFEIRQRLSTGQTGMLMGYCHNRATAEFLLGLFNAVFMRRALQASGRPT